MTIRTLSAALAVIGCLAGTPVLAQSAVTPPPAATEEDANEVSELLVLGRRSGVDPSDATTECLWRELPAQERAWLEQVSADAAARIAQKTAAKIDSRLLTTAGVAQALRACGAPDTKTPIKFARGALAAYGLERAIEAILNRRGIGSNRLVGAWTRLDPARREALTGMSSRMLEKEGEIREEEIGDDTALTVLGLVRSVRPLGVFNPFAYRPGATNFYILGYFVSRSSRDALERRF